jgi:hypothetical protein
MNQSANEEFELIEYQADTDKVNIIKDRARYRAERDLGLSHFKELLELFQVLLSNHWYILLI